MSRFAQLAPFNSGETVTSNFSRISAALDYRHARSFGAESRISFQGLVSGNDDAIEAFSDLLGCSPTLLRPRAVVALGAASLIATEKLPRGLVSRDPMRFCPHCVFDDEQKQGGRKGHRAFGRLKWLVNAVRCCPDHQTALVSLPRAPFPAFSHDFAALLRMAAPELPALAKTAQAMQQDALDLYVTTRLNGIRQPESWLEDLPLRVIIRVAEVAGAVDRHGAGIRNQQLTDVEWSAAAGHGLQILAEGPEEFRTLLKRLIRTSTCGRSGLGGRAVYGRLYEMLAHENNDPAFDPIRNHMKEVALEQLPLGPGDRFFGSVETRRLHSVHSAALQFEVHPKRLKKLLIRSGVVDASCSDLHPDQIVLDAAEMESFVGQMRGSVDTPQAKEHIGATRTHFETLVRCGFLVPHTGGTPSPVGQEGLGVERRFMVKDLDDLLIFIKSLSGTRTDLQRLLDITSATRRAGCSLDLTFRLLLSGALLNVASEPSAHGVAAINIDPIELKEKTALPEHGCLSLKEVEKSLGTNTLAVKALIAAGHLASVERRNPVKRHLQTVVEPSEIARFQREYISLTHLANARGNHFIRVLKELGDTEPAFDHQAIGVRFYKRSDVGA